MIWPCCNKKSYVWIFQLSNFDDPSVLSEETDVTGETGQLGFAISNSPVDKSAVYKMEENTLQEICNFLGRIKNNIKLAGKSILDTN